MLVLREPGGTELTEILKFTGHIGKRRGTGQGTDNVTGDERACVVLGMTFSALDRLSD